MPLAHTIQEHLTHRIENGELTNAELVQLIALLGSYLNLQTIPNYAKEHNMSYNGVKKHRKIAVLFATKFVIDNK